MSNNLMDHVLMNKLDDELGSAIQSVGGDISGVKGPWDYAKIIKDQLGVKCGDDSLPPSLDIKLGPGLKIEEVDGVKYLIATSAALTTCTLNPPTGSHMQPTDDVIAAGTPIQSVLESLFYEILPKMPSLYKGDIIKVDRNGSDKYNEEDIKSGLVPNATYLRLYISSRQEPVYILLSGHGLVNTENSSNPSVPGEPSTPGETIEYIGGETEYIKVNVVGNTITAELTNSGLQRLNDIELELLNKASQDDLDNLKVIVNAQTAAFNKLSNQMDDLNDKIDNIDLGSLENVGTEITNIKSDLDTKASQSDLNEVTSKVDSLEEAISNIDLGSLENVGTEIANIKSDLNTKASQSDLEDLRKQVDINTNDIAGLKDLVNGIDLNDLDSRISSLESSSITREEAEGIVTEKLASTEFTNTVQESVTNTLVDETNVEVQEAITQVVEKVIAGDSITEEEANTLVDDIFATI